VNPVTGFGAISPEPAWPVGNYRCDGFGWFSSENVRKPTNMTIRERQFHSVHGFFTKSRQQVKFSGHQGLFTDIKKSYIG
jgi:hypothetical protein